MTNFKDENPEKKNRRKYEEREREIMLKYILDNNLITNTTSLVVFEKMANEGILDRTEQSLHEHFRRQVVPNLYRSHFNYLSWNVRRRLMQYNRSGFKSTDEYNRIMKEIIIPNCQREEEEGRIKKAELSSLKNQSISNEPQPTTSGLKNLTKSPKSKKSELKPSKIQYKDYEIDIESFSESENENDKPTKNQNNNNEDKENTPLPIRIAEALNCCNQIPDLDLPELHLPDLDLPDVPDKPLEKNKSILKRKKVINKYINDEKRPTVMVSDEDVPHPPRKKRHVDSQYKSRPRLISSDSESESEKQPKTSKETKISPVTNDDGEHQSKPSNNISKEELVSSRKGTSPYFEQSSSDNESELTQTKTPNTPKRQTKLTDIFSISTVLSPIPIEDRHHSSRSSLSEFKLSPIRDPNENCMKMTDTKQDSCQPSIDNPYIVINPLSSARNQSKSLFGDKISSKSPISSTILELSDDKESLLNRYEKDQRTKVSQKEVEVPNATGEVVTAVKDLCNQSIVIISDEEDERPTSACSRSSKRVSFSTTNDIVNVSRLFMGPKKQIIADTNDDFVEFVTTELHDQCSNSQVINRDDFSSLFFFVKMNDLLKDSSSVCVKQIINRLNSDNYNLSVPLTETSFKNKMNDMAKFLTQQFTSNIINEFKETFGAASLKPDDVEVVDFNRRFEENSEVSSEATSSASSQATVIRQDDDMDVTKVKNSNEELLHMQILDITKESENPKVISDVFQKAHINKELVLDLIEDFSEATIKPQNSNNKIIPDSNSVHSDDVHLQISVHDYQQQLDLENKEKEHNIFSPDPLEDDVSQEVPVDVIPKTGRKEVEEEKMEVLKNPKVVKVYTNKKVTSVNDKLNTSSDVIVNSSPEETRRNLSSNRGDKFSQVRKKLHSQLNNLVSTTNVIETRSKTKAAELQTKQTKTQQHSVRMNASPNRKPQDKTEDSSRNTSPDRSQNKTSPSRTELTLESPNPSQVSGSKLRFEEDTTPLGAKEVSSSNQSEMEEIMIIEEAVESNEASESQSSSKDGVPGSKKTPTQTENSNQSNISDRSCLSPHEFQDVRVVLERTDVEDYMKKRAIVTHQVLEDVLDLEDMKESFAIVDEQLNAQSGKGDYVVTKGNNDESIDVTEEIFERFLKTIPEFQASQSPNVMKITRSSQKFQPFQFPSQSTSQTSGRRGRKWNSPRKKERHSPNRLSSEEGFLTCLSSQTGSVKNSCSQFLEKIPSRKDWIELFKNELQQRATSSTDSD